MRRPRLATVIAIRLGATLGVAMAAYGAVEILRYPEMSKWSVAVTHAWHVVALGVLLYATLLVGFDRTIGRPLQEIHAHLYRVATGKLEPLELRSSVREVADIVGSVNLMVRRMRLHPGDRTTQETAQALRSLARRLHPSAPEDAQILLASAAALEAGQAVAREGPGLTS
jgi:methyl-accepting chemotaxis protein